MNTAVETKAKLVIVDNASDSFGGNEIVRAEVRAFLAALRRIGVKCGGAVLTLLHVNRATASAGGRTSEFYSGSTAWNNSARARIAFYAPKQDDDGGDDDNGGPPEDDGTRIIELAKSNYAEFGAVGQTVTLRLAVGGYSLVGNDAGGVVASIRRRVADTADRRVTLTLIGEWEAEGHPVHANAKATSHSAATLMRDRADCPPHFRGRQGRARFGKFLRSLRTERLIVVAEFRQPQRRPVDVWRLTEAGRAALSTPASPTEG
jgi:hypothetical protein